MRAREPRVRLLCTTLPPHLTKHYFPLRSRSSWSRERRMIIALEAVDWTFLPFSLSLSLFLFTYAKRFPRGISSTTTRRDKFVRGKLKDKMTKLPAISYLTYLLAACNFFLVSTWMNKFIKMLRWFAYTTRKI